MPEISTAGPLTTPSVTPVHGSTFMRIIDGFGSAILAQARSFVHPWPKGPQDSLQTRSIPHSARRPSIQSIAAYIEGELVSRPPLTSVSQLRVSETWWR